MAGILNIGEMGALALHALAALAKLREDSPDERLTVQELAGSFQASVHTLQKVMQRLSVLGYAEAVRGPKGGLKLAVDPEKTTLLQVLEGVEGRMDSHGCLLNKRACPDGCTCIFANLTKTMVTEVRSYFATTTLADLAKKL